VRVFDFQRWCGSAPDNARLFQIPVQGGAMKRHIKKLINHAGQ
jgi:hypothetical protein